MFEIYCFDIGALLILITVLATILLRGMTKGRQNGIFIQLVCVTCAAGVFDILSNALNGTGAHEIFKYTSTGFYFVCRTIGFFLYGRYIIELSGTRHIFKKRWYRWLAKPPVLIAFALTVITYFTHICYFYSSKGYYIRGRFSIVFHLICGGYALFAILAIIKNHKYFGITRSLSLVSVAVFSVVTACVQYFYPYVVIDVLGFSVSLLFIMLFISNPEEMKDTISGLRNYRAYISDMTRTYEIGKPVVIIFANILNFPDIENVISFDNFFLLAKKVADIITKLNDKFKAQGDLYYLRNGRFRVVALESSLNGDKLTEFAEGLLKELNRDVLVNDTSIYLETNICVSRRQYNFSSYEELMNFGRLLEKEEKRDSIMYAEKLLETVEYDIAIKLDEIMERGILNNSFEIYYQPIYSVNKKKYTHAEALLRLFDYEFGLIDPQLIIQAAEANGSINAIGRICMEEVCRFISSNTFKELDLTAVAINISIIQLMQKNFADEYISIMQEYGVRSDQIIFEITESEAAEDQKSVIDNIEMVAKTGTKFSLNNYGTGYSNITTTSTLPLASTKIDRTLTTGETNDKLEVIIENSVKLNKSLGRTVVVVGVESEESFNKYVNLDVDYIQGYYLSKPLRELDFEYFIKYHNK